MRAKIKLDQTVRTIELDVEEGVHLDVTKHWHTKKREIQVTRVRLNMVDGQVTSVVAGGKVIKKDGTPGEQRDIRTWRAYGSNHDALSQAPKWLHEIAQQATLGIAEYTWTPTELAESGA